MSYYTVTVNEVNVLGIIWMPAVECAMNYTLSKHDIENMGEITRENVENWLDTHAGDFQSIIDFRVDIGDTIIEWKEEENEYKYMDCMYPCEE